MGNQTVGFNLNPPLDSSRIQSFVFSPDNGDIRSRNILLNGEVLKLTDDDQVPDFVPGSFKLSIVSLNMREAEGNTVDSYRLIVFF